MIRMVRQIAALNDVDARDLPKESLVFFDLDCDVVSARTVKLDCVSEVDDVAKSKPMSVELNFQRLGHGAPPFLKRMFDDICVAAWSAPLNM